MKNKILLPIILLATLALTGCTFGQQTGSEGSKSEQETSQQESSTPASESESPSDSSSDSEPPVVYGVAINNKAALQAEWHVRESSRDLDIALTPAGNVIQELSKKNLKIESSNSEVVLVNGVSLTAVGEGEATITVTYHEQVDTVALTVLAEKGEPDHVQATVEQILANLEEGKEKDVIYEIEAYVVAWQAGKTDATKYGNYMLADTMEEGAPQILVYGSSANTEAFTLNWTGEAYSYTQGDDAKDFLTNDVTKEVGIGSKLTMEVIAYKYGTTPEVSGIVKAADNSGVIHGNHPEPAVVNATMEEVWANTQGNGAVKFHVTNVKLYSFANNKGEAAGEATKYGNALLGENGEYFAYGLTASATALAWSTDAGMYAFTNPQDFLTNEVTKDLKAGAVVDLDLIRADYNTTKEVTGVITNVVSNGEGGGEENPEPAVVNATMEEVWADEQGNGKVKFSVKGVELHAFATNKGVATENASKYGNALLGETGEYFAYGLSGAASALSWDGAAGIFKFKNAQDFLTSDMTKDIVPGVTLDMDLIRCDYSGTKEVCGVVTAVHEAAQAEIAQPVGTFAGSATLADDSSVFVNVALGDTLAFVEVGTLAKVQTTYEFDNHTGLVTITAEGLGTVTAVFDENAKALTEITLDGAAAAYLKNNGEITLNHVVNFWDCNGTTAELQAQFKRRYMSGSWQVDNSNADRFVSYENGVAGSAMQRRGYSGGAVAVNFASDFEAPITVKNVGFWVYNPGASDITLRMWGYKAASFQSNFETGSVTAVAGQWTYCRMGFTEAAIYNFQIADFTNSGVALVFDNISLY